MITFTHGILAHFGFESDAATKAQATQLLTLLGWPTKLDDWDAELGSALISVPEALVTATVDISIHTDDGETLTIGWEQP